MIKVGVRLPTQIADGGELLAERPHSAGAQSLRGIAAALAARVSVQSFRQLPVISVR